MKSGRLFAIISVIVPLTLPAVGSAQGSSGFQVFTAYDNSFPGGAGMGGFGLTLGNGQAAVRTTVGFTLATLTATSNYGGPSNSGFWTGDVDFVISPDFSGRGYGGRGSYLDDGGIQPYGFVGIGAHSLSSELALDASVKDLSLGAGLAVAMSPSMSLDAEVRNRMAIAGSDLSSGEFVNGAEFRLGVTFHFGSPRNNQPTRPPTRPRR
jgi:hypothetical protein